MIDLELDPHMNDVYKYLVLNFTPIVLKFFKEKMRKYFVEEHVQPGSMNVQLVFKYKDKKLLLNSRSVINLILTNKSLRKEVYFDETILARYLVEDKEIFARNFLLRSETLLALFRQFFLGIENMTLSPFKKENILEI